MAEPATDGPPPPDPMQALIERSEAVRRMGVMMLMSGTSSYRVKLAMGRVAEALGIDALEAQVTLNEIVMTTRLGTGSRTQVAEVATPVVNADRISELMRLSLRATGGVTVAELHRQLDVVERKAHRYPLSVICAAAGLACAAFAFLSHGGAGDCLVAGVAASIGKIVQVLLRRFRTNHLVVTTLAAMTAAGMASGLAKLANNLLSGEPAVHQAAVIAATLFLVPGFPLITAGLDLARSDFASGMSRMAFAGLVVVAAGVGIAPVVWALSLPSSDHAADLPFALLLALRCVASFVGVLGFAVTFNTPPRVALATSAIGMIANVARLTAIDAGLAPLLCAGLATAFVGLLAGMSNQRLLTARITLSVPAVLVMIPGIPTYRAIMALTANEPLDVLSYGLTSLSLLGALISGLVVSRMLTDPAWADTAPAWASPPHTRAMERLRARP